MNVEYGTSMDIESWMDLVKLVSWNFPGLETEADIENHRKTVLRFMDENRALCVKETDKVTSFHCDYIIIVWCKVNRYF